ncbi:MAG: bifunctional diaminohydroxyphosphoribosylaminopyrimidine deaminase/5-amino-6-(5-phosphoribosylamino)uracil reductase RibD [Ichthyobacteriaceae bacterium]|nr:bifunctional diaminohydroxyphosphoribosylaminopyrimidine deaminase/5-amino-6-(5-phosphoribosylamino)uracil reductase RibD [Ichthyobacteriaceae bacterium]
MNHEKYMRRCLELAQNGLGTTSPNPMVGAVIVYNDKIIGEGWHRKAGEPHAEPNAIKSVKNPELLKKSTIYVSLEPCSHYGKTPPCTDLILEKEIPNIVIGIIDPFAKVCGNGINKLKQHGRNVIVGVLEDDCNNQNKRFFTFHRKNRPYVILKWAQTIDGFIDKIRNENSAKEPNWISNKYSKQLVHKWRSEEDAIMVGTNTAINDNPKLDTRLWKGKNPTRVVLDRTLRIPENYTLLDDSIKTIVITEKEKQNTTNIFYEKTEFNKDIFANNLMQILVKHNIQSIIIEGGKQTLQWLIDADVWDEARIFEGQKYFGNGIKAPEITSTNNSVIQENIFLNGDKLKTLTKKS